MDDGPSKMMLPPQLRNAEDKDVDDYIEERLLDSLRMILDPRVDQREVRSRSTALLNVAKTLGLDRDIAKNTIDGETVEMMLKRLRDGVERGTDASGRVVSKRTRRSPGKMPSGPEVFLCEPSESN
jgi:hypothetical protein